MLSSTAGSVLVARLAEAYVAEAYARDWTSSIVLGGVRSNLLWGGHDLPRYTPSQG